MGRGFVTHSMEMKINASREEVLESLKKNRQRHQQIVSEAQEGYLHAAHEVLNERLRDIIAGKIVPLSFGISPPVSFLEAYDTAIKMLEMHKADQIELTAVEVRCLVMDEWDWSRSFLESNKGYSGLANDLAGRMGV